VHIVQVLLPLYDNDGRQFDRSLHAEVQRELTDVFGGVTMYARAPARGLWQDDHGDVARDDLVICEVMDDDIDTDWWATYREALRTRFRQDELVVRAVPARLL
jgi:hypothetical protein